MLLSDSEEWKCYLKRYKKDTKSPAKRFSSEGDQLVRIATRDLDATHEGVFRASPWCLFNENSYVQRAIKLDSKRKVISEGLIKTYPSEKLKSEVMKHLSRVLEDWQLRCEVEVDGKRQRLIDYYYVEDNYGEMYGKKVAGNVQLVVPIRDPSASGQSSDEIEEWASKCLLQAFNRFGYDFTALRVDYCPCDVWCDGKLMSWIALAVLYFEARYLDVTFEKQRFMYHMTTASKLDKIKRNGLCAKSASQFFKYPNRVYLFNTLDFKRMLRYASESGKVNTSNGKEDNMWLMLQIDTSRVPSLKLYADTNDVDFDWKHPKAVFTYQSIPREAITKMKVFDLQEWLSMADKKKI